MLVGGPGLDLAGCSGPRARTSPLVAKASPTAATCGGSGDPGASAPTGRWSCVPGSLVVGPWWSQSWCQPSGGLGQSPGGSGSDASLLIRALSPDTAGCVPGGPMAGIYPLVGGTRSSTAGSSKDPMATGLLVGGVVSLPS